MVTHAAARAYPRWRGGNAPGIHRKNCSRGLSPLARGKRCASDGAGVLLGPIPAGAGETNRIMDQDLHHGAYPRWRGGNDHVNVYHRLVTGLSPLARGKRSRGRLRSGRTGPIPAGAGETIPIRIETDPLRAYPRWRGGNQHKNVLELVRKGLSPLARGKLRRCTAWVCDPGPIPAGAGETRLNPGFERIERAYPRWRGGNSVGPKKSGRVQGLSPLARGKHDQRKCDYLSSGPIPAGAGETPQGIPRRCSARAYPRWRGGNTSSSCRE